ncbi:MAG: hypothetical protein JWR24_2510 [Actinoallomurus sp.]|nr:hypothetical protein [Actinoallomurus sp.]
MIVDMRELDRRAVQATVEIVGTITANDLDRPTPCSQWTVHGLLEHQIVQNHGFAFAASGQRSELAIGFHLIDCVVHGWDLAKALGVPPNVDADLAGAALPLAAQVPDAPDIRGPGRAFQAGIAASVDAPPLDRVVALLGRSPGWSASARTGDGESGA